MSLSPTPLLSLHVPHDPGPTTLTPAALRVEQHVTLSTPRRRRNVVIDLLHLFLGLLYGRRASLQKFLVLEHLAQVPYRSWERVAQRRIARTRGRSALARRIQLRVAEARSQHDNEQWHMLVLEDLLARRRHRLPRLRFRVLPRMLAMPWQLATWLLHLVQPAWSYSLNAAFEDHAEHEYMRFVAAHPQLDRERFPSDLAQRWAYPVTVADVLRQIGHDERCHKLESIAAARAERGHPSPDLATPSDLDAAA
jgi:ubiquinol oxidase